jgi:hypothetical protein
MQWYPGPEGDQRVWYEADEIEQMAAEQLRRAGLMPTVQEPIVALERLIEGHLGADLDLYADLPPDVLGLTEFPIGGVPKVHINAALTEAGDEGDAGAGVVGRWRATLAHEASHIYLHRYLFDPEMASVSRGGPRSAVAGDEAVQCLHRDITAQAIDVAAARQRPDWREVQANRGMAALLMPRRVFTRVSVQQMTRLGYGSSLSTDSPEFDSLSSLIANTFRVSRQAAGIRLKTLSIATSR